ncbi:hypothetical protein PC115_g23326 [Phytophthora cactorum]|uniref:Uncharacterized protein n=1 Tax=Phytophthora cactorum TaxID=29920 RepID=A0A8T1AFY5_9STRA|nr:hypothetical protein PC115_g23326 [Phytophthora cactorum]
MTLQLSEAIQLCTVCLTKCYHGHDLEMLLYLAKAYYESKDFLSCIATLSRGLHMYLSDLRLCTPTSYHGRCAAHHLGSETGAAHFSLPTSASAASGTSSPSEKEKCRLEIETQCKLLREYEERVAREQEEARVKEADMRRRHEGIQLKQDERLKKLHEGW